jgi:hypothetical protein
MEFELEAGKKGTIDGNDERDGAMYDACVWCLHTG